MEHSAAVFSFYFSHFVVITANNNNNKCTIDQNIKSKCISGGVRLNGVQSKRNSFSIHDNKHLAQFIEGAIRVCFEFWYFPFYLRLFFIFDFIWLFTYLHTHIHTRIHKREKKNKKLGLKTLAQEQNCRFNTSKQNINRRFVNEIIFIWYRFPMEILRALKMYGRHNGLTFLLFRSQNTHFTLSFAIILSFLWYVFFFVFFFFLWFSWTFPLFEQQNSIRFSCWFLFIQNEKKNMHECTLCNQ